MAVKYYKPRTFNMPMDWASDEQLFLMQRELAQEVAELQLRRELAQSAAERVGLKKVEAELRLRGY